MDQPLFLAEPLPQDQLEAVELDRLRRFFQNPLQHFCERRLQLWLREQETELHEREPLTLDGLQKWSISDRLLRWHLQGVSIDSEGPAWQRLRRMGLLPLGSPGQVVFESLLDEVHQIAQQFEEQRPGKTLESLDVELELGGVRLEGRIDQLYENGRVEAQAGAIRAKHLLSHWILHLALNAHQPRTTSVLVGKNRGEKSPIRLAGLPGQEARHHLEELLQLYRWGQRVPLLFFPDTALRYCRTYRKPGRRPAAEAAQEVAYKKWLKSYDEPGDYGWLLGGVFPFREQPPLPVPEGLSAAELAHRVWGPLLEVWP